jgi:hypothetical protein
VERKLKIIMPFSFMFKSNPTRWSGRMKNLNLDEESDFCVQEKLGAASLGWEHVLFYEVKHPK